MKLVIDIDDEYYATITNKVKVIRDEASKNGYANNDVVPIGWVSIANGIPLDNYKDKIDKYIKENKTSDDLYLAGCGDGAYHTRCMLDDISALIEADKEEKA